MKTVQHFIYVLIILVIIVSCSTVPKAVINKDFRELSQSGLNFDDLDTNIKILNARQLFTSGTSFKQQGRYADAIIEFQEALRWDTSSSIYFAMAECYAYIGKDLSAIEKCHSSIILDSTFVPAYELLFDLYTAKQMMEKASIVADQLLKLDPSRENKIRNAVFQGLTNPKETIRLLEPLVGDSTDSALMILLAEAYERNEQTDKMSALLLKILKERPSDYDVAKGLINFYNDNNEFEKSFEILELTEKYYASAQLFESYNSLGYSISLYQGNKKEIFVSNYLSKIDERFYFEWTTQTISGKLSSQINDSVKTLEFYSRAMKLNDTIPFVFLDAALAFSNLKNYSKTNEILLEGKSKFKDDMQFDFYLCNSYLITKEYDKAHLYGKKLYEFDSMNVVFITLYASVLQEMKLYDESDRLYEQAIKIDPQDPSTNNNYAYSLSVRGKNLSKAERLSKFTVDTEPNNPAFLDTYGWIQYMLGNYDIALEYILKAIKNGEVSAEVFEHLGDIYIKLNKNDLALDAYMKSLELDKNLVNVIEKINILKN